MRLDVRVAARSGSAQRPLSRAEQMARIAGTDTAPETIVRRALWRDGLRGYRKHARTAVGRPDVVFPGPMVAVFIDGCFWHGCPEHYVRPRSRGEFWAAKLRENVERDRRQTLQLEAEGWTVVRAWEHEIYENLQGVVDRVRRGVVHDAAQGTYGDWRVDRVDVIDDATDQERRHLVRLREPNERRTWEGTRSTRKWKRPRRERKPG